jgi:hypothetical protein
VLREQVDVVDVAGEHEIEPPVRWDEAKAVLRKVALELGLTRGEEQRG